MAWEPVADVEIQCLAEPRSCVASPRPAELVGWHHVPARDASLPGNVLWHESRAAREVWLCGRGLLGAADFGEQPSTARKRGGREASPILGVVNPGRRGMWILLHPFLVSPLCQNAFFASFSFLFPFALSFGQDFNIYHRLVG